MTWPTRDDLLALLPANFAASLVQAGVTLIVGALLAMLLGELLRRTLTRITSQERAILGRRVVSLAIIGLSIASALRELGFDLSVLLGAAGILTVAVGFASQTSASNVISGLFLIAERPFSVGDVIELNALTGEVLAIDLLSVKLRTFDNRYVRLPNEAVMKATITNLTRFPIRRIDIPISLPPRLDLPHLQRSLVELAASNPLVLDEPPPALIFEGFGEAGIQLKFTAWTAQENVFSVKNALGPSIQQALLAEGVEVGLPQRRLGRDPGPAR